MEWKDLEKMTIVRLREEALKYPERITSVRAKDKDQLMTELAAVLGIEKPHTAFTAGVVQTKEQLKHRIRELKGRRDRLLQAQDRKELKLVRREIHRLKRQIRRIEEEAARKVRA